MFNRLFDGLLDLCAWAAAAILTAAAFAVGGDVVVRALGVGSWPWTTEVTEYGMMSATFLGAPWVLREAQHVRVDFVLNLLGPPSRHVANWLANLVGLACCIAAFWYSLNAMLKSREAGSIIYQQFFVPEWWTLVPMPFCFALLIVEFIRRLRRVAKGEDPDALNTGPAI